MDSGLFKQTPNARPVKVKGLAFGSIADASEYFNVDASIVYDRLRRGYNTHDAIFKPKAGAKSIVVQGKRFSSINEAARFYNQPTAHNRLWKGWSIKEAFDVVPRKPSFSIGYVYIIRNVINTKVYIGITSSSIQARFNSHVQASKTSQTKLACAMRKYSTSSFYVEKLHMSKNPDKLKNLEDHYIDLYDSIDNGYNTIKNRSLGTGKLDTSLIFKGKKYGSRRQLAKELGVSDVTVSRRIKQGKPIDENQRRKIGAVTINGVTYSSIKAASQALNIPAMTMYHRHKNGRQLDVRA